MSGNEQSQHQQVQDVPMAPLWNQKKSHSKILWLAFVSFVPLTAFSVTILILVFRNLVSTVPSDSTLLMNNGVSTISGGYYLVNFQAARLLFLASWSSTVAPKVTGFITALFLFPVAKRYLKSSQEQRLQDLPSPYQVSSSV